MRALVLALAVLCSAGCAPDAPPKPVYEDRADELSLFPPNVAEAVRSAEAQAQQANDQPTWLAVGNLCLQQGVVRHADVAYARAAALQGNQRFEAQYLRGVAAVRFAPETARVALQAAVAVRTDYAPAYARLGEVLELLGDVVGARSEYERALALEPLPVAYLGLGRIALTAGDDPRALEHLQKAWAGSPGSVAIAVPLAQALRRNGDEQAAQELASSIHPRHRQDRWTDPLLEMAESAGRDLAQQFGLR